jgi:hypothetical protein
MPKRSLSGVSCWKGAESCRFPACGSRKDGNVSWLYESKDIIDFLKGRLGV